MSVETLLIAGVIALAIFVLVLAVTLLRRGRSPGSDNVTLFESINRRLDRVEDLTRGVEDLSRLFLVPHARGGIGESLLEELLRNWLPRGSFQTQYGFRSGARVDAIVRIKPYIIPIDAKFPLESVRKSMGSREPGDAVPSDVRQAFLKHVDDIARKYIQPGEGTMQFALMYVPSERVYYEVFADSDGRLVAEALRRGVIPVSPSTLFLYLQTVAYGLRGLVIPEQAQELSREIAQLRADFRRFLKTHELAGTHLRNLQKAFDEAAVRVARVDAAIGRIGGDPGPFDRANDGSDQLSDGASE